MASCAVLKPSFIPLCMLVSYTIGIPMGCQIVTITKSPKSPTAQLTYSTRSVPERVAPAAASAALDAADVPTAALEEAWKQTLGRRARSKPFQSRSPAGVGYPQMVRKSWFTRFDKALRTGEFP